tara:strand:+ start:39 stop:800 length:762 start_codon:yes stop_codon:yes gene_type:complete
MAKLSQKSLLDESFTSLLKKSGAAVGAVGGALKAAADAGIDAGVGDLVKGGKAGYEKVEDMLTTKRQKLDKTLDDQGLMIVEIQKDGTLVPGTEVRGKKKLAVIDVVQYDYSEEGEKQPMKGAKPELVKYKYKDGNWEKVSGSREIKDGFSLLTKEEVEEVQEPDQKGPLTGKIIKHLTAKGKPAYGKVIGYTYEGEVAVQPFKGSRAPGIYGKKEDQVEESSAEEASKFYNVEVKEGTNQVELLRQLTLLSS